MLLDSSLPTKLLLNLNIGITSEDNSKPSQLKVKFLLSTKFMKKDPITLKLLESFLDINPELESITCTKSTEMFLSMEL
jgi:hypothetical protein